MEIRKSGSPGGEIIQRWNGDYRSGISNVYRNPMIRAVTDSKKDRIDFVLGNSNLSFTLAYNPPQYDHLESLSFQSGSLSDLSRFAPLPIPKEAMPARRFVKIRVLGLNLRDEWVMKGWEDHSDVVVFCVELPRTEKTVSFSPLPHKESYRPIQIRSCNALRISVEFDDGFSQQVKRPKFYVGSTSVTLKFREKWKSGANFTSG